jgi:hypothetical protein
MNLQTISQTFAQTLEINKVEFHPSNYGNHDVTVYCYFPYAKLLAVYGMSKDTYDRVNVQMFYGLLSVTFHLPIEPSDIIEAETENVQYPF